MIPTVNLVDEDLCRPSLYPEGTLVVKTWGPGAARATHLTIQRQLGALTGAAPSTLQVWRAEDPYRWYVVGPPTLHGKTGQLRDPACFYRIEELERETVRATVHWLPPTLKYGGLKKIVDSALGGGLFEKVPQKIDQAAVYVPKEKEKDIPHYTEINYRDTSHILLVTVPGRRTQCRHCTATDHWSNRCPQAENQSRAPKDQRPTFAEKMHKKPQPTKPTKPTATTRTDNDADVETDDETSTWTVVGPRNKRKRPGPTPKTSPTVEDSFYGTSGEEEASDDDNNNKEKEKNGDDTTTTTNINDDNNGNNSGQEKNNDQLSDTHI